MNPSPRENQENPSLETIDANNNGEIDELSNNYNEDVERI